MTRCLNLTDRKEMERLEKFLLSNPVSLFYHSPVYLTLLAEYLENTRTELWIHENSQRNIDGYFPLVFKLNKKTGNVCNSLPYYGSNGGIITANVLTQQQKENVWKTLLDSAVDSAKKMNCVTTTFITNPLDPDFNAWLSKHFKHQLTDQRIGQLTPLSNEGNIEENLMKVFEDPRPRNIRKAIKEEVRITWSNSAEDFDFLFATHKTNIDAIGGISKEPLFFTKVQQCVPENYRKVYIAEKNGAKIGALLLFYFNNTVEYFTPAVVEEYRNLQASSLLIFRAMCDAAAEGYKWWNWGGTWLSQGGVFDFKKKWGTENRNYYYYTQINDETILKMEKTDLLKEYPFFFVVPFDKLIQSTPLTNSNEKN